MGGKLVECGPTCSDDAVGGAIVVVVRSLPPLAGCGPMVMTVNPLIDILVVLALADAFACFHECMVSVVVFLPHFASHNIRIKSTMALCRGHGARYV